MSQDNRLMPLSPTTAAGIDRPLRELTQPATATGGAYLGIEPTHLRDYLNVVWKRKWLILSLIVVVTTLVAIQMYRLPSLYEAHTTIMIEPKARIGIKTKDVTINQGTDPAYWNTQLKLLQSPELARQVIVRLDLINDQRFLSGQTRPGIVSGLTRLFSSRGKTPAADGAAADDGGGLAVAKDEVAGIEQPRLSAEQMAKLEPYEDVFLASLSVAPQEKTNLVDLRFKHTNPELAQQVTDTVAAVFIENDRRRETTGTTTAKGKLGEQIIGLQKQIADLERQRLDYMMSRGIPLDPNMKGLNPTAERLQTTSAEALAAESEVKKLQAAYEAAQAAPDAYSIPEVQENAQVQSRRVKLGDLQERRAALLVQYTERHPEVVKIDRQLKQLEGELDNLTVQIKSGMAARLAAAKKKKADFEQAYSSERGAATRLSSDEIALNSINQQLETSKQLYNTLYQRGMETEVASNDRTDNITVQTPARLPRAPIGPPRVRNIFIAFLLALGAGVGLAFLLDYLDDTLKSIEDVDRHVHLPTLALIPAPRAERRLGFGRGAGHPEPAAETTALALIEEVRSPVAEAYRHLRTSLLLSSAGQPPKTVLVTSSQPSEGKTTTAVNIAVMLAQTGADVLLLDCDLRRPRIHGHFNLPNARGITNYLSGDTNLDGLIQPYERQPNLKVITSGPIPPNAAELLGSDEMRRLIHTLSERFTHVIIDSPPAISFTDASILSTMVDGVMLVVHGGRSSRAVVRRAKQLLQDVGAHIYGIVLNNVKLESSNYYYYAGYYYSSYYSGEDRDAPGDGLAEKP
ncbi:MAG: GumC family protein [Pyrinomonadaceae bacterium]